LGLLEFFSRQPLGHLEYSRLGEIPPALFLGVALSLEFCDVSIPRKPRVTLSARRCDFKQLILTVASEDVYKLLARPEFRSRTRQVILGLESLSAQ
jgi:hypothetical protein